MNTAKLSEVCQVIMGQAPVGTSYNNSSIGYPLVAGAGDFGELIPKAKKYTTKPTRLSNTNDIILCIRATIGDINWSDKEYCLGRGVAALRPDTRELHSNYLWYFILANGDELAKKGTGSTFKQVNRSTIEDTVIPLPPLAEQKRIAAILDKADALRRKHQQAIDLSNQFLRSVFLDMFGDPVTNPKGWPNISIEDLCQVIVDCPHSTPKYSESKTDHPCIRTSDLQDGYLDWSSTKYVTDSNYCERISRHKPIKGDVLYTREGERFGIAALVPENTELCLGQRMMLFQAKDNQNTPEFLWMLLNSKAVYWQATKRVLGVGSPHVNVGEIKKFNAIQPNFSEQERFSAIVEKTRKIQNNNQYSATADNKLFKSLSQKAFRGEL